MFMMLPVILQVMLNGEVIVVNVKNAVGSSAVQHDAEAR
jgi:hypothetical protein